MSKLLSCENLSFWYDQKKEPVFSGISFSVSPGEMVLLMGPSGCGKSTFAYCLAGLYPEYAGHMEGDIFLYEEMTPDNRHPSGQAPASETPQGPSGSLPPSRCPTNAHEEIRKLPISSYGPASRARKLSILFQNPDNQFCMDRVDHEVMFALENMNFQGDIQARTRSLLAQVGLLEVEMSPIRILSGGMKQKLALCTALATEARMLVLDEPFANLDPASCASLAALLAKLNRQGMTLLVVDHRPGWWRPFLSRIVFMEKEGDLDASSMSPREFETRKDAFLARGLFYDDDWLEEIRRFRNKRFKKKDASCGMSGQAPAESDVPDQTPARSNISDPAADSGQKSKPDIWMGHKPDTAWSRGPTSDEIMVNAEHFTILHGKKPFMQNLTFQISKGSVTALVGACGSGKTTLLHALAGIGKCKGSLQVHGRAGLVFQNPRFQFLGQTVEEEILMTLKAGEGKPGGAEDTSLIRKAHQLLEEFGLLPYIKNSPYALSQGQQRRLALLAMLACDCALMLLDEPTYAQDEQATRFILALLERRVAQGLTVIMATHDLALAEAFADRVFLVNQGQARELDDKEWQEYVHRETAMEPQGSLSGNPAWNSRKETRQNGAEGGGKS